MDICFWNKCNNNCLMCSNPDDSWRKENYGYKYIVRRLSVLRGSIADMTITGGEPTIHPDFLRIIDFLKRDFPRVRFDLLTNGRRFYYPVFAKKCLQLRNVNIAISLNGYSARTHDSITSVKGSFEQTISGIKNILKYKSKGQNLEIRIIITKISCIYAHKILTFIQKEFPDVDRVVLIFMEMEGMANKNIEKVGITYKEWASYMPEIGLKIKKFADIRFYHFPLCTISTNLWKNVWRTLPKEEVVFPDGCYSCWCKQYCLGVHVGYLKNMGSSEFRPPKMAMIKRSNNFHHPIADVFD